MKFPGLSILVACFCMTVVGHAQDGSGQPVDAGISGTWFDAERSGEGWMIQVIDDSTVVIDWLTYPPPGSVDPQAWIYGVGRMDGSTIHVEEAFTVEGLSFTTPVALGEIPLTPWGSYSIEFDSCDQATVDYNSIAGFGSGSIAIQRLSSISGLSCDNSAKAFSGTTLAEQAAPGSFVHPDRLGQGWLLENSGRNTALMTWFTHRAGRPAWLFGQGVFDGTSITMFDVVITEGGVFGPDFDPADVVRSNWGDLQMRFDDCNSGSMRFASLDPEFGADQFSFARATALHGLECDEAATAPVAARSNGSWSAAARMPTRRSEVAVASIGNQAYVFGGFGNNSAALERFDADSGTWERLPDAPAGRDHAMLAANGGKLYVFGGAGSQSLHSTVFRFDPTDQSWTVLSFMPQAKSAGAAVSLDRYIYLVGGVTFRGESNTLVYDTLTDSFELLAPPPGSRDHAAAVLYNGEIWLLGGRGSGGTTSSTAILNPVTKTWRSGPSMTQVHSGFAAAVLDGQIYVGGGEDLGSVLTTIATFEVYSPLTGWQRGPHLPTPVHGVQAAALNGRIHFFGGATSPGSVTPSNVATQVYTPD